jgi:hypothetical protein
MAQRRTTEDLGVSQRSESRRDFAIEIPLAAERAVSKTVESDPPAAGPKADIEIDFFPAGGKVKGR